MSTTPLLLVGPRCGKRITGVRLCFDLLIEALVTAHIPHEIVDTTAGEVPAKAGTLRARRIMEMLRLLPGIWRRIFRCKTLYLTLSTSRPGFLRDALVIWPAAILGRRLVGHLHGGGYAAFYEQQPAVIRWILHKTLRRLDTIIVLAEALRDQFAFDRSLDQHIRIVGNGLPMARPSQWPTQKTLAAGEPIRILYLSNMIVSKGYRVLLDACSQLVREHGTRLQVDFCGEFVDTGAEAGITGEPAATFAGLLADTGLAGIAKWHGVVDGERKNALLADTHLLVLPTAYPWEGQPICIIEAFASATPVVASDHRAIPEMFSDGVEGRLVPTGDSGAVANAILELTGDPQRYGQTSAAAFERYDQRFRKEHHTARMLKVLVQDASTELQT